MGKETTEVTPEIITKWQLTKPLPPSGKLTQKTVAAVLESIANGNYIERSCAAAGITAKTFRNWQDVAENEPDSAYAEFADLLEQARAHAETQNVGIIQRAAATNWTAAAWLLERQYPQRWGRRDQVHSTVDAVHTLRIEWGNVAIEASDETDEDDRFTETT